jgi:hypothetical protein
MKTNYRGFGIERVDRMIQVGHDIARLAGKNVKQTRSVGSQVIITYPDSDATKVFNTIRAAELYIDNYLGEP